MKKFLKNIAAFGTLLVLLMVGLEYYLTLELKNRNSEGEVIVWEDLYENTLNEYNHFIYGSSRAWVHIDPMILEKELGKKYYNLGADGQNFTVQKFRHKELARKTEIKSIIYSVDINTFIFRNYIRDYDQFLPFMFWENNGIKEFLQPYNYYSSIDYYLPLTRYYGHRNVISDMFFSKDSAAPSRIRGYKGQERKWNDDFKNATKEREFLKIKIDYNLVNEFDCFLKELLNNNIQVVLVYTPELIEGQNYVSNRSDIIDIYRNLSTKYGIPFFDFSTDSLSYERKYYYNASHLNKRGAELFTSKLADSLKVINSTHD